jgi:hypothetical protein
MEYQKAGLLYLTSFDFFCYGYIMELVYQDTSQTENKFLQGIANAANYIQKNSEGK